MNITLHHNGMKVATTNCNPPHPSPVEIKLAIPTHPRKVVEFVIERSTAEELLTMLRIALNATNRREGGL